MSDRSKNSMEFARMEIGLNTNSSSESTSYFRGARVKILGTSGEEYLFMMACRDACSTGAAGAVAPLPSAYGDEGVRFALLREYI